MPIDKKFTLTKGKPDQTNLLVGFMMRVDATDKALHKPEVIQTTLGGTKDTTTPASLTLSSATTIPLIAPLWIEFIDPTTEQPSLFKLTENAGVGATTLTGIIWDDIDALAEAVIPPVVQYQNNYEDGSTVNTESIDYYTTENAITLSSTREQTVSIAGYANENSPSYRNFLDEKEGNTGDTFLLIKEHEPTSSANADGTRTYSWGQIGDVSTSQNKGQATTLTTTMTPEKVQRVWEGDSTL